VVINIAIFRRRIDVIGSYWELFSILYYPFDDNLIDFSGEFSQNITKEYDNYYGPLKEWIRESNLTESQHLKQQYDAVMKELKEKQNELSKIEKQEDTKIKRKKILDIEFFKETVKQKLRDLKRYNIPLEILEWLKFYPPYYFHQIHQISLEFDYKNILPSLSSYLSEDTGSSLWELRPDNFSPVWNEYLKPVIYPPSNLKKLPDFYRAFTEPKKEILHTSV